MKNRHNLLTSLMVIILASLFSIDAISQDYKTIRVNGTILLEKANMPLETGTVFEESDDLLFKTYNSIATVINSEKGRFIIRPDNVDLAYAKASYTPAMSNISARSGTFVSAIDIKNQLTGKYVLFDEIFIKIHPEIFPMTEERFFFLRYEHAGETINKKLSFSNDTLIISKSEVFSIDGTSIEPFEINAIELWYMEQDKGSKITLLSSFEPIIIDNTNLKREVSIIFDSYENRPENERIHEALAFINEFYGTLNRDNFEYWLQNNMGN